MKLVHLVGFITKKFVTMHGHMNVNYLYFVYKSHEIHMLGDNNFNLIQESISYTSRYQWPCDTNRRPGAT